MVIILAALVLVAIDYGNILLSKQVTETLKHSDKVQQGRKSKQSDMTNL